MRWQKGRRSRNVIDRRGKGACGQKSSLGGSTHQQSLPRSAEEDQLADFVKVVLADTEDTWNPVFQNLGRQYRDPAWFVRGLKSGDISACDTFSGNI